ncbi:unnamed protein product [Rotaria sordida]|uniref:RUN domain-containing protein n=1 Tax=Rotaria sordida TaxID=392033 RepID=A0A814IYM1_9BILA|nr:unnamed protein product [Rotaria sordida]
MNNSSPSINSLLSNLKSIIELVIKCPGNSLIIQYGAIQRIRSAIFSILLHGFKQDTKDTYEQLWHFIIHLNSNSQKYIHLLQDIYHKENLLISIEQWIDQSLITQCLSQQLSYIENDIDILEQYYYSHAFLRIPSFYHAFRICIRTIESNNLSLLANIDPKLSIVGNDDHATTSTNDVVYRSQSLTKSSILNSNTKEKLSYDDNQEKIHSIAKSRLMHRRIHSDPLFHIENISKKYSRVTSSLLIDEMESLNQNENISYDSYSFDYGSNYDLCSDSFLAIEQSLPIESNRPSISSQITLVDEEECQFHNEPIKTSDLTKNIRLPYSSLYWPRKGQTLDDYIRECDSQTRTDVEKENAHFYFSEAIISAIEYIKFSEQCKKYFDSFEENIITLNKFNLSDEYSKLNSYDLSAEAIALAIMNTWKNYKIPKASDLFWMIPHEEETLEELPPIQDNKGFNQSEEYTPTENSQRILRRGTSQWAPPREQLIFHIHQSVNRDSQLKKQGYLCAGCGRDVEKGYAHRFRYCEYTGKYFCRSCHSDKKFYLPSYIITKWDFSNKHSVSNFAFDYLNRIYTEAIFNINGLNPKLFQKSNKLKLMNELRCTLYFLRRYILSCRFAEENGCQQSLQTLPSYIYEHPYIYSLEDLVKTKLGELHKVLEPIVMKLRDHVLRCSLCFAKGFICEICNNEKSIIFPFNLQITSTCPGCQSCFHTQCYENGKLNCPKCQRTKTRNSVTSSDRSNTTTTNA